MNLKPIDSKKQESVINHTKFNKMLANEEMEKKILNYIRMHPLKSISQIAENTKINRMTVSKYLFALEMFGKVKRKDHGMRKLWYYGKRKK